MIYHSWPLEFYLVLYAYEITRAEPAPLQSWHGKNLLLEMYCLKYLEIIMIWDEYSHEISSNTLKDYLIQSSFWYSKAYQQKYYSKSLITDNITDCLAQSLHTHIDDLPTQTCLNNLNCFVSILTPVQRISCKFKIYIRMFTFCSKVVHNSQPSVQYTSCITLLRDRALWELLDILLLE